MLFKPITHEGYKLFHEGCIALSQVEANGIKIDTKYLAQAKAKCQRKIDRLQQKLFEDKIYKIWKHKFKSKTKLGSREQLGTILFNTMKYPCNKWTEPTDRYPKGRPVCDEAELQKMNISFVSRYLETERWKQSLNTFLKGIEREITNGFIHPFFNLNTAKSFRSSSDSPNSQNWPIRQPEIAKLIRSAFIPRSSNRIFGEFDFKGVEVSVAACYNEDPILIKYVSDDKTDMHRDMACQCFILPKKQITKDTRYVAKNRFVFPEFYGNWYKAVGRDIWEGITELKLCTVDGKPLKKHLKEKGIRRLGKCDPDMDALPNTFERHIHEVEKDFWERRFKVYNQWKKDWNEEYLENGYIDLLTGFRCSSMMDRKQCVNYPIQGSAFHCLLWSLIRIQKLLRKYNMKSLIIGQIHDSMLMDIVRRELKNVIEIVKQVTTVDLAKHWRWIIVPMKTEVELAPPGRSWYEKKEIMI